MKEKLEERFIYIKQLNDVLENMIVGSKSKNEKKAILERKLQVLNEIDFLIQILKEFYYEKCHYCNGSGKILFYDCDLCSGYGIKDFNKNNKLYCRHCNSSNILIPGQNFLYQCFECCFEFGKKL